MSFRAARPTTPLANLESSPRPARPPAPHNARAFSRTVDAYDVWAQKDLGTVTTSWSVTLRTHQSAFVILTPK